jgi:hypothetical protein
MEASKEVLTETEIEYGGQRLVFSKPLTVRIRCAGGKITLESNIGISGAGSDFESAWKSLRAEISTRWKDPLMKGKHFPAGIVDRDETVKYAVNFKQTANQ